MLTTSYPVNKFLFRQLGKILVNNKPEWADELISKYLPERKTPIETDLTKIPFYFKTFCHLENINPKDYTGALYKSSKIDKRRFFIAVVILLYHPQTRLLQKYISETLQQDPSATRRMMIEVEFRYKKMEDFRLVVDSIVKKIR